MRNIFVIEPGRLGALDVLIPLAMELRKRYPDLRLTLIYFTLDHFKQLQRNTAFVGLLRSMGRAYMVPGWNLEKWFPRLLGKFLRWFPAISVIIPLAVSRKSIFMAPQNLNGWRNKVVYIMNKVNVGRSYVYIPVAAPFSECLRRHFDENLKPRNPNSKTCRNTRQKNTADGLLIYHETNTTYLKLVGLSNFKIIGYPILFDSFRDYVLVNAGNYVARELGLQQPPKKGECVTVFINKYWGIWASKDDDWAREAFRTVVECIREHRPNAWILVRPHPMLTGERLEDLKRYAGGGRIVFTNLHPSMLAVTSSYVIALAQSSTFLHVMGYGTPYIEYGEMTEEQYRIFPEGSLFAEFGTIVVRNREALREALPRAERDKTGLDVCRRTVDHATDVSLFIDYWG